MAAVYVRAKRSDGEDDDVTHSSWKAMEGRGMSQSMTLATVEVHSSLRPVESRSTEGATVGVRGRITDDVVANFSVQDDQS